MIYFLVILFAILTGQFVQPPEWLQLFGCVITLIVAPILVVIMASLHALTPAHRKIFSQVALGFTLLFTLAVSINRFTQLGVVRQSLDAGNVSGISWFLAYGEHSVMLGIEYLGWSWFLGLTALAAAPLFSGNRLENWLRGLFLVSAGMALLSAVGFLLANLLSLFGFVAWGLVLFIITGLLAVYFRQDQRVDQHEFSLRINWR